MSMGTCKIEPCELPDQVVSGIHRLMSRLGLVYGALDFRVRPDGEHVFLEINPAGQWLFIEDQTRQPISQAVAKQLACLGER